MKFFAVFVALVAAVAADYHTWTLPELSDAIQNPNTDPALLPALEQALNDMMDSLFAESDKPVDLTGWTLAQLSDALQNPETDPALIPHLEHALNEMMDMIIAGIPVEAVGVPVPAMETTVWTLPQLSAALEDPTTNPALIPYLEHALNEMMDALYAGEQMGVIAVVAPAGLAPILPEPEVPVIPTPVVEPTPVEAPAVSTSPLVQIIINIQQQS